MSWATPENVIESWIGDDAPDDEDKLQIWIDRAERLVRSRVTDVQARLDAEAAEDPPVTTLLETVIDVVVAMVTRKFQNPRGKRQTSITTGPFSEQETYGGDNPGELTLLDSELDLLSGSTVGTSQAFTVDVIPKSSRFSESYVWPEGNPFGWNWGSW